MKKKISLIIAAAALATLMVVGGTLAWFTDTEEATNVITMGNVDVQLIENEGWPTPGGYFVPGDKINKNPIVKNVGKNDALVRAKVTVTATNVVNDKNDPVEDKYLRKAEDELWGIITHTRTLEEERNSKWKLSSDNYFYYTDVLISKAETSAIFDEFKLPDHWNNIHTNIKIDINIVVEAIQSDNVIVEKDTYTADEIKAAFGTKIIYDYER